MKAMGCVRDLIVFLALLGAFRVPYGNKDEKHGMRLQLRLQRLQDPRDGGAKTSLIVDLACGPRPSSTGTSAPPMHRRAMGGRRMWRASHVRERWPSRGPAKADLSSSEARSTEGRPHIQRPALNPTSGPEAGRNSSGLRRGEECSSPSRRAPASATRCIKRWLATFGLAWPTLAVCHESPEATSALAERRRLRTGRWHISRNIIWHPVTTLYVYARPLKQATFSRACCGDITCVIIDGMSQARVGVEGADRKSDDWPTPGAVGEA